MTPAMSQTWIVFTDASFEHDPDGAEVAGFGGVLVSPQVHKVDR